VSQNELALRLGVSFCAEKPDPSDVDGYWIEPDGVYDRIERVGSIPRLFWFRKFGNEVADVGGPRRGIFHPSRYAGKPTVGFPDFFRQDRECLPKGVIQVIRSKSSSQRAMLRKNGLRLRWRASPGSCQSGPGDDRKTRRSGSRQQGRHDPATGPAHI
jgi:hypothetical protein